MKDPETNPTDDEFRFSYSIDEIMTMEHFPDFVRDQVLGEVMLFDHSAEDIIIRSKADLYEPDAPFNIRVDYVK